MVDTAIRYRRSEVLPYVLQEYFQHYRDAVLHVAFFVQPIPLVRSGIQLVGSLFAKWPNSMALERVLLGVSYWDYCSRVFYEYYLQAADTQSRPWWNPSRNRSGAPSSSLILNHCLQLLPSL